MKKRVFLIPGLLASFIGALIVSMTFVSPSEATSSRTPPLTKNSIRIEFVDTGTYRYGKAEGTKLERMIDSQLGVVCYRREPAANYDCVKL